MLIIYNNTSFKIINILFKVMLNKIVELTKKCAVNKIYFLKKFKEYNVLNIEFLVQCVIYSFFVIISKKKKHLFLFQWINYGYLA